MSSGNDTTRGRSGRLWRLGVRTAARGAWMGAQRFLPGDGRARTLDALGDDWFDTLGELKGAAMKLGQFASQFRGAVPDALIDRLTGLQQSAQPLPFEQLRDQVEAAIGPLDDHFAAFDTRAFAAASMGQVHRARLHDGRAVVVKIRYPGVADSIDDDIRQLARVMKSARLLNIDPESIESSVAEIAERLHEEADYRIERDNLRAITETGVTSGMVLPEAIDALCTDSVLVLTDCPGQTLGEASTASDALRQRWAQALGDWLLHQVLVTGVVHADPNPANFGFVADGRVVLYDFGCIKRLPGVVLAATRDSLSAALAQDWRSVHDQLDGLGALAPRARDRFDALAPLYAEMHALILAPLLAQPTYDFAADRIHETYRSAMTRHLRHIRDFRSVPDWLFVGRTLSGYYWMFRQLAAPVAWQAPLDAALTQPTSAATPEPQAPQAPH